MSRMTCRNGFIFVAAMCLGLMVTSVRGGSLDDTGAPTDGASAMYTAQDLYNRLAFGTNAPKRTGAFMEPTAGPTAGTMSTTDDIMAKAPVTNASGAVADEVVFGKTFWGLTQGAWGTRTGTIATVTLSATTAVVNAGYYAATNLALVDTDLAAGNIKTNVTIFGVAGTYEGGGGSTTAPVPKTGQTNSYANYDDGWYSTNNGVAWPNPRFSPVAESGDATNQIRDNLTGLIWARNANIAGVQKTWAEAFDAITNLDSGVVNKVNYGGTNDWRLPNVRELHSLIAWQFSNPALSDGTGTNKWTATLGPFVAVRSDLYWSSTTAAGSTDYAWYVRLDDGYVNGNAKVTAYYVWPVRGGQ